MTKRTEIRRLVEAIHPLDDLEQKDIASTLKWIDSGAELFRLEKPAHPKQHLVAYFALFDLEVNSLLLVDHRKAGLWLPPGGHVELGEHPQDTVKREVREELGIEADFLLDTPLFLTVTETVGQGSQHTDVSLWYVLRGKEGTEYAYDREEFHQVCWFPHDQIPYKSAQTQLKRFHAKLPISKECIDADRLVF